MGWGKETARSRFKLELPKKNYNEVKHFNQTAGGFYTFEQTYEIDISFSPYGRSSGHLDDHRFAEESVLLNRHFKELIQA